MDLNNDFIAQDVQLSLNGKHYTLRPWNVGDKLWLAQEYGDKAQEMISKGDLSAVVRAVYRLIKDRSAFKPQTREHIDESGMVREISVGGVDLLKEQIIGKRAEDAIAEAFFKAVMAGEPAPKENPIKEDSKQEFDHPLA